MTAKTPPRGLSFEASPRQASLINDQRQPDEGRPQKTKPRPLVMVSAVISKTVARSKHGYSGGEGKRQRKPTGVREDI